MPYIENLDEIKSKLDIESVLKEIDPDIQIKKHGSELRSHCPVHKGDGPENFSVNQNTQAWFCHSHGCKGAGTIELYSRSLGVDFTEATQKLADRFGIPVKFREEGNKEKSYSKDDIARCWEDAKPQGKDTYFSKKGLPVPPIARFGKNPKGFEACMIPLKNIDGKLTGLLCLSHSGKFVFGEQKESFALLGELKDGSEFFIGEGIATVQTAWESYSREIPSVSCGSWGNILPVLTKIKEKYPNSKPIQLIDCDEGECGLKAAKMVAKKYPEASFRKPSFEKVPQGVKCTDFNDLISVLKLDSKKVKEQLEVKFPVKNETDNESGNPINELHLEVDSNLKENHPFNYILENNSEINIINELKNVSPGINTGFKIGEIDLILPGGALSVVAMPTGHGKSTSLINFALGALNHQHDKNVYFFSYEESSAAILCCFFNTFQGKKLSKNNRKSIESYFRTGSTEFISNDAKDLFISDKKVFFESLIDTGRLRVHYTDMTVEKLVDAIKFIKQNSSVGLVCIDYFQLLKSENHSKLSRQEQLKEISLLLKDAAVETGLPIVLGAQFNREVMMEADLSPTKIREAADIEQISNLIIGGWNREHVGFSREKNKNKDGKEIPHQNAIYFEVLKGRGIGNGHNSIFEFDGNIGKISNKQGENVKQW